MDFKYLIDDLIQYFFVNSIYIYIFALNYFN